MIVYMLGDLCVWTDSAPPFGLAFDGVIPNAPAGGAKGKVLINGAWSAPTPGSELANVATLRQQAENALAANLADIATNDGGIANNDAWLAANPGNSLAVGVLTPRVKVLVQHDTAAARQRNAMFHQINGVLRQLIGRLDSTD